MVNHSFTENRGGAVRCSEWQQLETGGGAEEGRAEMLQQYAQDRFQAETVKSAYYEVCWFQSKCPVNEWTHQFFTTLIFSLSLHIVHIVQIRKKTAKKKKSFTVWLSQNIHRAKHCLFAAACRTLRQMKSLSAASPDSRPSPKSPRVVRTQSRYEFVTCRHFILSCRQLFSQEAAPWLQAALGQVFLSAAFLCEKKKKKN